MLAAVESLHTRDSLFCFEEQLARVFHSAFAGGIEADAVAATGEKGHAELFFKVLHGAGDGRLRDVERFGSAGEGATVGEGDELRKVVEIEHEEASFDESSIQSVKSGFHY